MRAAFARLDRLEQRVRDVPSTPTVRRLAHARRLYGAHPDALARLLAAPDDPEAVAEYRLDQFLLAPISSPFEVVATVTVLRGSPGPDSVRLRPLRLVDDPAHEPFEAVTKRGGLVIPAADERFDSRPRFEIFPGMTWLPPGAIGEPLLVYGERHPDSWEEAHWLAGTSGDALYLGDRDGDARAIRAHAGTVEARRFGQSWRHVGTV